MRVSCPTCSTAYNIDDSKIPPGGAKLKCSKCQSTFPIGGQKAAPPPPKPASAAPPGAVPLPGNASRPPPSAASPRTAMFGGGAVPLPGNASRPPPPAAVPLPGSAARNAAVPLPGSVDDSMEADLPVQDSPTSIGPVPLPGSAGEGGYDDGGFAEAGAVPLPGSDYGDVGAVPLPGGAPDSFEADLPTDEGPALPLPGRAAPQAAPVPLPGGARGATMAAPAVGARNATMAAPAVAAAVPLPGAAAVAPPEELSFDDFGSEPAPAPAPAPDELDFGAPAPAGGEFDLPDAAPPPPGGDAFALDFDEPAAAPPPPRSAPPPAAPPPGDDPFAADLDAFGAPDAAPPPEPAPAPAAAGGGDDLEFDPTAPARPKTAPGGDDLEADLSAPLPSAAPAAPAGDDLELLDFIDDAAAAAKAKQRPGGAAAKGAKGEGFQVRNKQGKVFGPLPEHEVTKLLGDGKLLGNEDISQDGENWVPLGSHPVFAEALQKLMEAPGGLPGAGVAGDPAAQQRATDVNERIKQVYAGRMAGITVVDSQQAFDKIRKRLPLIIGGTIAGLFLLVGLGQGLTPNGIFWRKKFFPTQIKPGDPLFQKLVEGRASLELGSFGALKQALGDADTVLKENDGFLNARALYASAVFALGQRYKAATPADLQRAQKYVDDEWRTHPNVPEVLIAKVAEDLASGATAEEQRPQLEKVIATSPELAQEANLLLARSYLAARDRNSAKAAFVAACGTGKGHARALTALGLFFISNRDYPAAATQLEKAVAEKADYGPAALELATLRITVLALPEKVEEVLKPLAGATDLSDEEKARIHALTGMVRVYQKKAEDAESEFKQANELAPNSPNVQGAYAGYLLKRRDYEHAEPLFAKAYAAKPDDLEVLDGYVTAMVGRSRLVDATKVLVEAEGKLPNNPRVAYLRGLVSDGADKADEAEKNYKAAIVGDPKLVAADLALGRFYLRKHKIPEAKAALDEALKKAKENPEVNTAVGEVALAEGRDDEADQIFQTAIKLDADLAAAHLGRAKVLLRKKDLAAAHSEAETALKQDEKLPGVHRVMGMVLQAEKAYDKAKAELLLGKEQDPKDEDALLHLGMVEYALGNFDPAQTSLEDARTINRGNPETYFFLALAHFKKHENTQAIDNMGKAMEFGGQKNAEYHYNFGLIYRGTDGRYQDALEEFSTALKLKPDYADALEANADALAESDYAKAIANYEAAYAADNGRMALLGKVADAYAKAGQHAKAVEAYKRHLAADPSSTADYYKMGRSYDEIGKRNDAIEAYKTATKKDAKNAQAWYYLGYALRERNKYGEAVKALETYIKLVNEAGSEEQKKDISEVQDTIDAIKEEGHLR